MTKRTGSLPLAALMREPGKAAKVTTILAGIASIGVLIAIVTSQPRATQPPASPPTQPAATERGNPALAQQLAEEAALASDSIAALRLLIAAHVVAPDRATHRLALARAVLGTPQPTRLDSANVGAGGAVRYASVANDGSFLIVDRRDRGGQIWQLRTLTGNNDVKPIEDVGAPVTAAAGVRGGTQTTVFIAGTDGVSKWVALPQWSTGTAKRIGKLADTADAVAIRNDAKLAAIAAGATVTLWDPDTATAFDPHPLATLSYGNPVTALDFAPGDAVVLAAGHPDGTVTVDAIDLNQNNTHRRFLAAGGTGPVDIVTTTPNGTMALTVTTDGTLSVWTAVTGGSSGSIAPMGTSPVGGQGPYRAWLSPDGTFAIITGTSGLPAVWSLADPTRPEPLLELQAAGDAVVPALLTDDAHELLTITTDGTITTWSTKSIVDTLNEPTPAACALAPTTDPQWRAIVADPLYANPCPPPVGLPTIGVQNA